MHKEHVLRNFSVTLFMVAAVLMTSARASVLSDAADGLQPGEWTELQTQGYSESLLSACKGGSTIFEWANKAVWDPVNREVHFVGQGHVACAKHIRYQEGSNSWSTAALPSGIGDFGHGYEHNAVNPLNGDIYYRSYSADKIEKYSAASKSWSVLPRIGTKTQVAGGIAYFPEADGLLYVDGDYGVYFYSNSSNSWSLVANTTLMIDGGKPQLSTASYHNFASYNPADKVVYFGGGNGSKNVYKFDAQRRVSQIANSPVSIGINSAITLADPSSGKQLVFSNDGSIYAYNSQANSWSGAGTHPVMSHALDWRVATPISTHGVIMFMTWRFSSSKVLLYRYAEGGGVPIDVVSPMAPASIVIQ